ncbi:MAG TPA: serine protease [Polyangiaceae bacterium]|nr:serine protease [Polyangiaceae bacterium]
MRLARALLWSIIGTPVVTCAFVSCATPVVPARPAEKARTAETSGAPPPTAKPPNEAAIEPSWVTTPRPDLRRLTVVVKAQPPRELVAMYRGLAARYKVLKPLFSAHADESFGSGFVMVRREAAQDLRVFVVTNRHVVGLASEAAVSFEGADVPRVAKVVYVDDVYDLAVLALESADELQGGLSIEPVPARDQDLVVASGFPGIAGKPSYQVTRGYVSNERFSLSDGGSEQHYVQHTAPIDPGSSGGPLTTQDGRLLGVNTLKVRNRENVGLAVPAAVVDQALAEVLRGAPRDARAECEEVVRRLDENAGASLALERSISARMVAEQGLASLSDLPGDGSEWRDRFIDDPTEVFLRAIALRLQSAANTKDSAAVACTPSGTPGSTTASFKTRLGGKERTLTFGLEQSRWKLLQGALSEQTRASFLDEIDRPRGPRKKWKPSLK